MVSVAGTTRVAVGEPDGAVVPGADVLLGGGWEADGNVTGSTPLLQPVTATTIKNVDQARLLMSHSYPLPSRHACHLVAGP
jgi:hypothetical protein